MIVRWVLAALAGLLFGIGLGISTMTQPIKVIGFLDVFGQWDLSLLWVMVGAVGTHTLLFRLISATRKQPLLAGYQFCQPATNRIDVKLVAGAVIFGVGWGLGGYCPGPAIVSLATLQRPVLVFCGAMIAGILVQKSLHRST